MIEGKEYMEIVKSIYLFLKIEFGFSIIKETINGIMFYDVEYSDNKRVISVSYENVEDHLQVIIFLLQDGKLPDYEDKTKTLHLEQLSRQIMSTVSNEEFKKNAAYFDKYITKTEIERKLLKGAKELRLCLKYLS